MSGCLRNNHRLPALHCPDTWGSNSRPSSASRDFCEFKTPKARVEGGLRPADSPRRRATLEAKEALGRRPSARSPQAGLESLQQRGRGTRFDFAVAFNLPAPLRE